MRNLWLCTKTEHLSACHRPQSHSSFLELAILRHFKDIRRDRICEWMESGEWRLKPKIQCIAEAYIRFVATVENGGRGFFFLVS